MPRNEYGKDDPEMIRTATDTSPLFAPVTIADELARNPCACGAVAVTMRVVDTEGVKSKLAGMCARCAADHGEREKREILRAHGKRRKKILEWLNTEMISLYRDREARDPSSAWVTVVDARRAYRRAPDTDPKADLRFLGSLFRARGWEKVPGVTAKNTDEGNHARPVDCWRYVGGGK